jgi:hypothetical protein
MVNLDLIGGDPIGLLTAGLLGVLALIASASGWRSRVQPVKRRPELASLTPLRGRRRSALGSRGRS